MSGHVSVCTHDIHECIVAKQLLCDSNDPRVCDQRAKHLANPNTINLLTPYIFTPYY